MAVLIGFDADYWGDEEYFVQTIRHFGKQLNFATFSDYDQIAGPLVFAIYGLWGKLTRASCIRGSVELLRSAAHQDA